MSSQKRHRPAQIRSWEVKGQGEIIALVIDKDPAQNTMRTRGPRLSSQEEELLPSVQVVPVNL